MYPSAIWPGRGSDRWTGEVKAETRYAAPMSEQPSKTRAAPVGQSSPPTLPGPVSRASPNDSLDPYHTVAETVGMLPSLRVKDNVIQAAVVLGCAGLGAAIGFATNGGLGAIAVGAVAMIASALISGLVLMVLGWVRAAKRRRR
jgi:hypothetical protein